MMEVIRKPARLFLCAFCLLLQPAGLPLAWAQTDPAESLCVGVIESPPLAIHSDGDWDGIGVHLWREVASELNLAYELCAVTEQEMWEQIEDGSIDVAIPTRVAVDAEESADFTHSYFHTALGLARVKQRSLLQIASAVLTVRFWRITLWLSVLLLLIGVLAWLFERNQNSDMFGGGPLQGIWAGFWWAGVTMTTIGYGDKAPITVGGCLVALFWMLSAISPRSDAISEFWLRCARSDVRNCVIVL